MANKRDSTRSGLPSLRGQLEIERLRERLAAILWAVENERYQLQGLRAFVRQQGADALDLDDGANEEAARQLGAKRRLRLFDQASAARLAGARRTAKPR